MANFHRCERRELATISGEAYHRHLTSAGVGTISIRLPLDNLFLITPAEIGLGDITPEEICLIDSEGNLVDETRGLTLPPETPLYMKAYQDRSDVNAIAHLQPPYATAYAACGQVFHLPAGDIRREIREVLKVVCRKCPSRFTGLCVCNTDIRVSFAGANTLLVKEDGLVTMGSDLPAALRLADLVEKTAKLAYLSTHHHEG